MNRLIKYSNWFFILICLAFLDFVIRFPITPHEIGSDSFVVHFIADSITRFGHAKWWIHPLSIMGLYPYSEESALPFYLSGLSQSISLDMERSIWIGLVSMGIFSAFSAYLMAGAIRNDKIFKFVTAIVYSTSPGILVFTTWNASSRGLFLAILPLFLYFLIKSRYSIKYGLLAIGFFILLMATHNFFFLLIPIIIVYGIMLIYYGVARSKILLLTIRKGLTSVAGIILVMVFIIVLLISFKIFSDIRPSKSLVIYEYARYVGILGVFLIGGFFSLLFKYHKTFEEWFLIITLLMITPFLPMVTYSKFFILPFASLLIGYGMTNLISISQKREIASLIVVILILFSLGVAAFYQFGRTDIDNQNLRYNFWAPQSTIDTSMWIKDYANKEIYIDDELLNRRMLAYLGKATLSSDNTVNIIESDFDEHRLNLSLLSPYSTEFYTLSPFHEESTPINYYWYKLKELKYDSERGSLILKKFNFSYYVADERSYDNFSTSIKNKQDELFDNGMVSIWSMKK